MGKIQVVVGAQWGDEGKGKWIDYLSQNAGIVARYQGGNNAGHTLWVHGKKYVFHHLPSGVLHPHVRCALLAGTVISPSALVREMQQLPARLTPENFWLSSRSHIITPWHIFLDSRREQQREVHLGTTQKGIGPTYSDRSARLGLTLADYIQPQKREAWLQSYALHHPEIQIHREDCREQWQEFAEVAEFLRPYVCDAQRLIREELKAGTTLLCEGAQGTLLDLSHGTYPFVTSSHTVLGGALASLGLGVQYPIQAVGIAKAYATRVGEGPFPTELTGEEGKLLARLGGEKGATTGRPRRCGWLDGVALRYACEINGFHQLFVNKIDVLAGFETIRLCTAYRHPQLGEISYFPESSEALDVVIPVYESFEGWEKESLPAAGSCGKDLPPQLQKYLDRIAAFCGVPITYVGIGAAREDFCTLP